MIDEFIRDLNKNNDDIDMQDPYINPLLIEKDKIVNDFSCLSDLLLNFITEKRLNFLLKKKLVYLENIVKRKREENEVKSYFKEYFSKDIYLKNQVIYSRFHQGTAGTIYLDKKAKIGKNNKKK